jgi:uncharacterized membrane protein YphA (DoxX/SURF4 family)
MTNHILVSFASLILRLALGAIFIYHGYNKVNGPRNDWGASWATNQWQSKPPDDVLDKLEKLPKESSERIREIQEELKALYTRESTPVPEALHFTAAQIAVAWGELAAGVALVVGFLTRLAALGMVVIQAGAVYTVTWAKGFSLVNGGGYEYNLALLAMCVAVFLIGGGALSVDRCAFRKRKTP